MNKKPKKYHQVAKRKTYLYKAPSDDFKTKMYLIRGDSLKLLSEKIDQSKKKWFFINYRGKNELNMWIKSDAIGASIDLPDIPQNSKYLHINKDRVYLYDKSSAQAKTKMYLIKDDKVVFFAEEKDASGQKWLLVNFKGKKDLYMWIRAETVR